MPIDLTITSVEIIPIRLPLKEPFVISYGTFPDVPTVLVRVRTRDGLEGWGEATPDQLVTGETFQATAETLRRDLAPLPLRPEPRRRGAARNSRTTPLR